MLAGFRKIKDTLTIWSVHSFHTWQGRPLHQWQSNAGTGAGACAAGAGTAGQTYNKCNKTEQNWMSIVINVVWFCWILSAIFASNKTKQYSIKPYNTGWFCNYCYNMHNITIRNNTKQYSTILWYNFVTYCLVLLQVLYTIWYHSIVEYFLILFNIVILYIL